ncbi:MAG: fasciclin domain-containing protein [Candidatus Dojkabacteria bacterium]
MADTIYKYLLNDGGFKTFIRLIGVADGLVAQLDGKGSYTVFAPTDEAFSKLEPGTVEKWTMDGDILLDIFRYHMLNTEMTSDQLKELAKEKKATEAADRNPINFDEEGDALLVGNNKKMTKISKADIKCSNGVIHIVDDLLSI